MNLKIFNFFDNFNNNFEEIYSYRYVLIQLVKQQLILKYRRTILGYTWNLLNPLLMMSITAIVFSSIYKMDLKSFTIYMFSGTVAFNLFSQSIISSTTAFLQNEGLLTKVYIPRIIFPLSYIISIVIDNVLMTISLSLIIFIIGAKISFALLFLPFAYILTFAFSLGFSLIISIASIYLRDLQHIISILMQALLFLSPVFIKPALLSGKVKLLYSFNPLTYYINLFRMPLFEGKLPQNIEIIYCILFASFSLIIGLSFFNKYKNKFIFML